MLHSTVQAVVASICFLESILCGLQHLGSNRFRSDLLLSRINTAGQRSDRCLVSLESNGCIGLLDGSPHFGTHLADLCVGFICHLRQRLESAVHKAIQRMLREEVHGIRRGHDAQQHIGQSILFCRWRAGQVILCWEESGANQRSNQI